MRKIRILSVLLLFLAGCSLAQVSGQKFGNEKIADGEYEGEASKFPNSVSVRITVKDGKVTDIIVLKNTGSWIASKAEKVIPGRIISEQSTDVDAVSGATNSSRVIMNAVENALAKARVKP